MVSKSLSALAKRSQCANLPSLPKQARTFFVGGNFKSNGSISSIKAIIEHLNKATLNPAVGKLPISRRKSNQEKFANS